MRGCRPGLHLLDDKKTNNQSTHAMDRAPFAPTLSARPLGTPSPAPRAIRLWLKRAPPAARWPSEGILLHRLPFVVGRLPRLHEAAPPRHVDLRVPDSLPYRLSPVHFCVLTLAGELSVMDADSDLGTCVNGVAIGRELPRRHARLHAGMNVITAGPHGGHWVFDLHIGGATGRTASGHEFTFG